MLLPHIAGLFNIMVGLMLVAAILFFFSGLTMWFSRLHTWPTWRDETIKIMEWGVVILFVLAAMLTIVQFVQQQTALTYFLLGVAAVGLVAYIAVKLAQAHTGGEDAEH